MTLHHKSTSHRAYQCVPEARRLQGRLVAKLKRKRTVKSFVCCFIKTPPGPRFSAACEVLAWMMAASPAWEMMPPMSSMSSMSSGKWKQRVVGGNQEEKPTRSYTCQSSITLRFPCTYFESGIPRERVLIAS